MVSNTISQKIIYNVKRFESDYLGKLLFKCKNDPQMMEKIFNRIEKLQNTGYDYRKLDIYYNNYHSLGIIEENNCFAVQKTNLAEKIFDMMERNIQHMDYFNTSKFATIIKEHFPNRKIKVDSRYMAQTLLTYGMFEYCAPNFESINISDINSILDYVENRTKNKTDDFGNMTSVMIDQLYTLIFMAGPTGDILRSEDIVVMWIVREAFKSKSIKKIPIS